MTRKKYRHLRADLETDRRVFRAKERIVEILRPLSDLRARRVMAAAAILLGHGDLVGFDERERDR